MPVWKTRYYCHKPQVHSDRKGFTKMPRRFFSNTALHDQLVQLEDQEARHLRDAMRLKVGESVELFNGRGTIAEATILKVEKRKVELEIESRRTVERPKRRVTIASAIPKGDRFRWMIEKLTELNVDRFVPLQASRSVVSPGDGKMSRMNQVVIAASKQCGRDFLMEIEPIVKWDAAIQTYSNRLLIADPEGPSFTQISADGNPRSDVVFAIGPEGGFTPEETESAITSGAKTVCFGATILRIETAAIAAAALGNAMMATVK